MEFYISPENREKLLNKLTRMFKHLEQAPKVNIGTVETVKETIVTVADGGYEINKYKIQAIHVEIEDIKTGDWKLVATVDWENGLLIEDRELFKMIPEGYGLNYMFMIMSILNILMERGVIIYTVKERYRLGEDLTSKVLAFAFSISAEIERTLISQRTTEALRRKKAEGVKLGRPKGKKSTHCKLSGCEYKIKEMLNEGYPKSLISRQLNVSPSTLYLYLKENKIY